jgi:sigma-E factor negative regulatory protein RseA
MTNIERLKNRALASELTDGRLRGSEFAQAVKLAIDDADVREAWHVNHVIGDVLRFGHAAGAAADVQFVDRFRMRLSRIAESPAVRAVLPVGVELSADSHVASQQADSANSGSFRWKMVAGFASFVAVAAIAWSTLTSLAGPGAEPQLAQSAPPAALPSSSEPQVMIRDPHLDALLAAHKQFGGTSALQMPAGFLRNATFESPSR